MASQATSLGSSIAPTISGSDSHSQHHDDIVSSPERKLESTSSHDEPKVPAAAMTTGVNMDGSAPMRPQRSRVVDYSMGLGLAPTNTRNGDGQDHTLHWRPWRRAQTPWSTILSGPYDGSGTKEDPYLVSWLATDVDPENPQTMPQSQKWGLCLFVSFATLAVALSSSAYSGATSEIQRKLGGSNEVVTLGVSLFVLGFAIGPLFWAPLSEIFGRRILYIVSYSFLTLWTGVAIASPNVGALIAFRFLAGAFGSSPLTNAGGTIADIMDAKQRGLGMALFAAAPFMGPALGPITGGFLTVGTGDWKPVMIFLTAFCGLLLIIGFLVYPETYAPVLLRRRAAELSQATGKHYISRLDKGKDTSIAAQFKVSLSRPWLLLAYEPIVLSLSLYVGIIYAVLYSFFGAFPLVFQGTRGWNAGESGLAFLGILVGMMTALGWVVLYDNPRYVRIAEKHGGVAPPEARLLGSLVGAVLLPIGLIGFAVTNFPSIHFIVPIIMSSFFGAGMVLVFLSLQNYLVDSYLLYAASVLAANSVIRSVLGAAFPLFTRYMYTPSAACDLRSCGIHVGPSIAALLAIICLPFPFVFRHYGARVRAKCRYASQAAALLEQMKQAAIRANAGHNHQQEQPKAVAEEDKGDAQKDVEKQA